MRHWAPALLLALALATPTAAAEPLAKQTERAQAAYRAGRYQEALEAARGAAQSAPRSVATLLLHAGMAEFLGEFDEAGRAYAQAQALAPNDMVVHYRVAVYAVRIGEYDRALRELDAILALQPESVQLLYRYAPTALQKPLLAQHKLLEQLSTARSMTPSSSDSPHFCRPSPAAGTAP